MDHLRVRVRSLEENPELKLRPGLCKKKLLNEWHHDKLDCEGCSGYDDYCPRYKALRHVFRTQENILI